MKYRLSFGMLAEHKCLYKFCVKYPFIRWIKQHVYSVNLLSNAPKRNRKKPMLGFDIDLCTQPPLSHGLEEATHYGNHYEPLKEKTKQPDFVCVCVCIYTVHTYCLFWHFTILYYMKHELKYGRTIMDGKQERCGKEQSWHNLR